MQAFQLKLDSVRQHYLNGDISIGFRQLTDCVLDTRDLQFYKQLIAYTEWFESEEQSTFDVVSKAIHLIDLLVNFPIEEKVVDAPLLVAESLGKTYGRRKFQLKNVSLNIYPGDVWGLVGENGNGKTTLLRILANELSFDTGSLSVHLSDSSISDYEMRTRLVYIPQRTPKWYGSLKSNLKFTATHYGITGEENELIVLMMIIRFGLWNYRNHQWNELSSGYKMRFELARTFLRAPKILLLDEPLANLDVLAQQLILEDLKSLSQSISNPIGIILSSQQLFEVEKVSNKVLFLRNGEPTHLADANEQSNNETTVIECDVKATKEQLLEAFNQLPAFEISYNGGMYMLSISAPNQMSTVLKALATSQLEVTYVRDISQSTRRLFI